MSIVDRLLDIAARFAAMSATNYAALAIATAVLGAFMAAVLLLLRQQVLREERWLGYLGAAFALYPVQYGLRAYGAWRDRGNYQIERLVQAVFSNANSLLIVLAAFALLYWLPRHWWRRRWGVVLIAIFVFSALAGLLLNEPWGRRFEALLSVAVFAILGWALYMNSGTHAHRRWALLNLIGALLYACLHLVYVFVPEIARSQRFGRLLYEHLHSLEQERTGLTAVGALDSGLFALAFVFKFMLFVGALLVVMRCLSTFSPSFSKQILEPVKTGRDEFLTSDGIVRAMAESIGSAAAALSFRLPGSRRDEVTTFAWAREVGVIADGSMPTPRPLPESSTIGRTLESTDVIHSRNWHNDPRFSHGGYDEVIPGMRSFLNMPLLHHGAVVGCLNFQWTKPGAYTATDVQRVRQIAEYITPVVQAERWLSAVADLRERLQFYNADLQREGVGFIGRVGAEVHDVLAPEGTLLLFEFGFISQWAMCIGVDKVVSSDNPDEHRGCHAIESDFRRMFSTDATFVEIALPLRGHPVGKIILAIHRDADELTRPSLTTDRKQLSAIAVLVKDTLFDIHRNRFATILHGLHSGLNFASFASEPQWLKTLSDAASAAGMGGVTVRSDGWGALLLDGAEMVLGGVQLRDSSSLRFGERRVFRWTGGAESAKSIVELILPQCSEVLYVDVQRPEFGAELEAELPWKLFIDRMADAADSALMRIRAIELESDAMQFEMNSLLVHELRNPAEEFQQAVEWLDENLLASLELPLNDSRRVMFNELKRSAWKFMELANAVVKPITPDSRPAVSLLEIRDRVDRLFGGRLAARGIHLNWDIGDGCLIGVPLHLAYIVLVSVVQNAREAIGDAPGQIRVQAENDSDAVLLHVDDTGGGIAPANRSNVFKLGFTTKKRGSGRGLVLAQRALHRYKGDLYLADQTPAGVSTRFTIRFPGAER